MSNYKIEDAPTVILTGCFTPLQRLAGLQLVNEFIDRQRDPLTTGIWEIIEHDHHSYAMKVNEDGAIECQLA